VDLPILTPDQLRQHLQSLRRARGLTQAELGQLLGVGQVRVANIEHDPGSISVEQFMRLLACLDARLVLRAELAAPGEPQTASPKPKATARAKTKAIKASKVPKASKTPKGSW